MTFNYRLKVVSIALPPLRERSDDIPLLVQHFVQKFNLQTGKALLAGTREAIYFGLDDLPDEIGRARISDELLDLDAPAEENVERQRILSTLKSAGGLSEAARQLGNSRTTLWRKLKRIQRVRNESK